MILLSGLGGFGVCVEKVGAGGIDNSVQKMEHNTISTLFLGRLREDHGVARRIWDKRRLCCGTFCAVSPVVKKFFSLVLLGLIFCVSTSVGMANNFYVRQGATGANNGLDWNNAWSDTANIVWSSITAGDSVWIAGGTYTTLTPTKSGSAGNPISIYRVRATNSVPVAAAGWNSSFDSQVILTGTATMITVAGYSYLTFDGQVPYNGILLTNTAALSDCNPRYCIFITSGPNNYLTFRNIQGRMGNN